jgi:protease I
MKNLIGKRVAVLVERDYEDQELWYPLYRLREAGAEVVVIGPQTGTYNSKHDYPVEATLAADDANPADFDGVVVPGGWAPDRLRRYASVTNFVKALHKAGKMVAAICHGPHVLISAGVVHGRRVAAVIALKDDLTNAGATFVDAEAVRDGNIISARTPDDLPAFMREVLAALETPAENA